MNVQLAAQPPWIQSDLTNCKDCHRHLHIDVVTLCGWHENVVTVTHVIAASFPAADPDNLEDDQ